MAHLFTGVGVAVTTPFRGNVVDFDSFKRHLENLIDNNIQCLVINGTTGEGSTLSRDEKKWLLDIAVETAAGRVPVIAGTGSNSTEGSIQSSLDAKDAGVDGIMLITPYYNKTSQKGLVQHFTAIVEAVDLPAILYNVPSRTNMTIAPETVQTLSKHKNIVGLKDATGDFNYFSQVKLLTDDTFACYSGNDDTFLPFLSLGGDGLISVAANVLPKAYQTLYEHSLENMDEARALHYKIYPLVEALGVDVNPIPIKALTAHAGFGNYELRLPLVALDDEERQKLTKLYDSLR